MSHSYQTNECNVKQVAQLGQRDRTTMQTSSFGSKSKETLFPISFSTEVQLYWQNGKTALFSHLWGTLVVR